MSMSPEMGVIKPMALLPFPPDQVGTYSCHGVEPGMRQGETSAKINQDRGCVIYPFGQEACPEFEQALFCVFDGHGACGDKVSQFTAEKVPGAPREAPEAQAQPGDRARGGLRHRRPQPQGGRDDRRRAVGDDRRRRAAAEGRRQGDDHRVHRQRWRLARGRRHDGRWRQTRCADGRRSARATLPAATRLRALRLTLRSPPPLCAQSTWTSRRTRSPTRRTR